MCVTICIFTRFLHVVIPRSLSFFSPCHRRRAQRWLRLGQCAAQESRCQDGITGPSHLPPSFAVVVLLQATLAALPSDHLMPILPIPSLSNQISYIGLLIHMQPRSCRCRSLSVLFGLPLPRLHSMDPWYTIAISAYRFKLRTPSAQVYDVFHPLAEAARRSLVFLRTSAPPTRTYLWRTYAPLSANRCLHGAYFSLNLATC